MRKLILGASALAMAASLAGAAFADEEVTAWRLFVSDHAEPVVTVIDALDGDVLDKFTIRGPANLFRSAGGEAVYAVQGAAGVVTAIASGISFDDHGDHADIDVEAPKLTGFELSGKAPSHFVEHDGHWAAFFDGEGLARVFEEHEALEGHVETREVAADAPHHGVVIPFGSHDIVSVPDPADPSKPPVGVKVVDSNGNQVGDTVECVGLHGEATSGNLVALGGCADGILVVRAGSEGPVVEPLRFVEGMPQGRVSALLGGKGLQYFLGNYGADKVVLIDPAEAEAFRIVDLPMRRVHFAVDPVRAKFAYIFTEDGQLHQLDVVAGAITHSLKLTDPYSMDGHWSDPRPRVAVAGDNVVVTDPLKGLIHLVSAETFRKSGEIAVAGKPFNVVSVGGSGKVHDHGGEDGHDHAHGDGLEGHSHHHGDDQIYKGYFEDTQVKDRPLSDWAGDWQSVYTLLQDGTLDPVMAHKAESGSKTADEYRAYYETGYRTDVERIEIGSDSVKFYKDGKLIEAHYASDGYEILTYEAGNRGVRFIFKKTGGDAAAPQYIQFSDHKIAPEAADHYHLYWGDDRAALLKEVTNWPTYYPSSLSNEQIVQEMIAH